MNQSQFEIKQPSQILEARRNSNHQQQVPKLAGLQQLIQDSQGNLSQRRNSGIQSLFLNTMTNGSTLQSARSLTGQVNLESTQELKAFATIDLAKINKERSDQLQQALEDNLKEKEDELLQIQKTYTSHKDEYERINLSFKNKSLQLEEESQKLKSHIANLKQTIKAKEQELVARENTIQKQMNDSKNEENEIQDKLNQLKSQLTLTNNQLEMMIVQRKSYQMSMEMQKKVRIQELDMKLIPLNQEKEKIDEHLSLLYESIELLEQMNQQSQNERQMIQEDLEVSESIKVDLVFQREELEGYIENMKDQNEDVKFVMQNDQSDWEQVKTELVQQKERDLLLNLIRELQQYILGMSSNTTDNSVMQSEELEDVQSMLENRQLQTTQAIEMITQFTQHKMKINLDAETLILKVQSVRDNIDFEKIKSIIEDIHKLYCDIQQLDDRIKVIFNRCQNELKPRLKALDKSTNQVQQELEKAIDQKNDLENYNLDLQAEISSIQQQFDAQFNTNQEEYQELQKKLNSINSQIQDLEYNQDTIKQQIYKAEEKLMSVIQQVEELELSFNEFKQSQKSLIKDLKEELKRDQQKQSQQESNPSDLSKQVAQLKCDKESANKRLKYVETKLQNAKESLSHAKSVLDNHMLQSQQEQLNQRRTLQATRKGSFTNLLAGNINPVARISQVEQKANSLARGKMISPSRDQESPTQSNNQSVASIKPQQLMYQQIDTERMHDHFIDYNSVNQSMKYEYSSTKKLKDNQYQSVSNHNSKSTIDQVRYFYDSSSAISSEDNNLQRKKTIPCQQLITPREALTEIQSQNNNNSGTFIYETFNSQDDLQQQETISSRNESFFQRKNSFQGSDASKSIVPQNNNHLYMRNQRMSNKQHNASYDGKQLKNVVIPLFTQFKENITPNQQQPHLNIKRLSQATNLSSIHSSQNGSLINRPPAVPSSKLTSLDAGTPRGSSQKKLAYMIGNQQQNQKFSSQQFKTNDDQFHIKGSQKIRLVMNQKSTNGKPTQVGIVDIAKCHSSMRDQAFFENVKPLIEGSPFLFSQDKQLVVKQMYLDFSLLRINIDDSNGDKQTLMVEHIVKPELPPSTLEQIRLEKNGAQQSRKYEFNIIVNANSVCQKMKLVAMNYDELKQWIVGVNALIANKTNLTRLSTLINY